MAISVIDIGLEISGETICRDSAGDTNQNTNTESGCTCSCGDPAPIIVHKQRSD